MKTLQLLALGLASLVVTACNELSQPAASETAAATCHCTQAPPDAPAADASNQTAAATPSGASHRWHHRYVRRWARSHRSESASTAYDYELSERSTSDRVSEIEGTQGGGEVEAGYSVWVDGYGRRHCYYTGHHDRDDDAGWQRAGDDRSRLDPWKGYDDNDGPENGY